MGSIGNSYPPNSSARSLLMADIRCLPGASSKLVNFILESCILLILIALALNLSGMEGSPVFSEQAQFIGLLTRPLRQKISGTEVQV